MNYSEALAWLYSTQRYGIKLGLENVRRLLGELELSFPAQVIHVAGTNGKGSVCAMADAICRAAGHHTGLFTSPHLISFRERIRVGGEMIAEDKVACGLTEIRDLISTWDPHPTFFEIATALALQHFRNAGCEILILETGMGGRLDATNAVPSSVSVITPIDFDHEKWLGYSIAEIATEKAGIIKPHVPVVSAPQSKEAETVIRKRAAECDAPLEFVNEPWTKSRIGLRGEHQKLNAGVAVAALRAARISFSDHALGKGLAHIEWPARFQTWDEQIVIDGAHNPAGARTLQRTWRDEFGAECATVILAILRDKNASEIIDALRPMAARFLLPQIRSERAESPANLAELMRQRAIEHQQFASTADAISAARKFSERILITGSLHFAGEALAILQGEPDALEESAQ